MNRLAVLLRMVLDVTEVRCRLVLKVNCARNQSGATCAQQQPRSVLHISCLLRFPGMHSPTSLCTSADSSSYTAYHGFTVLEGASFPGLVIP